MKKKIRAAKKNGPKLIRRYRKYSREQRVLLIYKIVLERKKLTTTARELEICPTSARLIVNTFLNQHRIFERKQDQEKRQRLEKRFNKPDIFDKLNQLIRFSYEQQKLALNKIKVEENSIINIQRSELGSESQRRTQLNEVERQSVIYYLPQPALSYYPVNSQAGPMIWMTTQQANYNL